MSGGLLGPDGIPLHPKNPAPLHNDVEILVELKVNTALDRARDEIRLRTDLAMHEIRQEHNSNKKQGWIKFSVVTFVVIAFAIFHSLYWPDHVKDWTKEAVEKFLTRPEIAKMADEIMKEKMEGYIDTKISGLSERVGLLNEDIKQSETSIKETSDDIYARLDLVAQKASNIEIDLINKTDMAAQTLQKLSDDLDVSSKMIESFKSDQDFLSLVYRAENNDYDAFFELRNIIDPRNWTTG